VRRAPTWSGHKTVPEYVPGTKEGVGVKPREETKVPRRYKVLMHNDDYTTMEFVVQVLQAVFRRPHADAVRIMLRIHKGGVGVCGVYPSQIAEVKIAAVHDLARSHGFPLLCTMEEE